MAFLMPGLIRRAIRTLRPWRRGGWCLCALLWSIRPGVAAPAPGVSEYQLKAVFLFNFAQFVEWPETAFADPMAPFVVGVLGEDPFGDSLDAVVRDERVNGHPLVVRRFRRVEDVEACHILFVGGSDPAALSRTLSTLKGRGVLTVGDTDAFTQRGGMIRFFNENNRVRLRINLEAARAAGLTISSKLLRPAEIVTEGRG